jgi:hypothetical protein
LDPHLLLPRPPGDVQGEPLDYDDEIRDFIIECYRLDEVTGRRVYREAVLSRPKGRAKSEIAGMVAVAEGLGPVRFDGWDADGQPVGRPVRSPLIKCLATEESQAGQHLPERRVRRRRVGPGRPPGDLRRRVGCSPDRVRAGGVPAVGGEIRACTAGAASKDGGKETFVVPDESHLYVLPELKNMYATVMRNLPKRRLAEPWALQTTTAYRPGEQSIAEDTLTAWRKGELSSTVYVNHREGKGRINIDDRDHTVAQLRQVYGAAMHPITGWMDPGDVYETMTDPRQCPDHETAARYYLNRPMSSKDAWIAKDVVERQIRAEVVAPGTAIALGFDGSLRDDATVLLGCRMTDGFLFPVGIWAKPAGLEGNWWEVPRSDVLATIREAFARYTVSRLYMPTRTSGVRTSTRSPPSSARSGSCRGRPAATWRWPRRWTGCART